jgi:ribose 5-phosphate isomerase B
MKIYFAADHAGFELKNTLLAYARDELGAEVEDCGAFSYEPADDYPPLIGAGAGKLGNDALQGLDSRGVFIGASGQGEAMAANRHRGVRAALYYGPAPRSQTDIEGKELDMLSSTREHNNANALVLAARFLTADEAKDVLKRWLSLPFSGAGRHARRIRMLDERHQ